MQLRLRPSYYSIVTTYAFRDEHLLIFNLNAFFTLLSLEASFRSYRNSIGSLKDTIWLTFNLIYIWLANFRYIDYLYIAVMSLFFGLFRSFAWLIFFVAAWCRRWLSCIFLLLFLFINSRSLGCILECSFYCFSV